MTTNNQTTTVLQQPRIAPEIARKALHEGKIMRRGQVIHIMTTTLSDLPPIKNDQLVNHDFCIIANKGTINTEYGEAWIFDIGRDPSLPTDSWLVGIPSGSKNDSVIGKNLKRYFDAHGWDALPLWTRVEYKDIKPFGYYYLTAPLVVREAAEFEDAPPAAPTPAPVAPPPPPVVTPAVDTDNKDELPW